MKTRTLAESRTLARQLLKQFRSPDVAAASRAATRLLRLRSFAGVTASDLLADRERVRLKHALAIIALENGCESWVALTAAAAERDAISDPAAASDVTGATMMYASGMDAILNRWFVSYADAVASLEEMGGYLFPYKRQFFICESQGVVQMGLDPDDPDWARIGRNWVEPRDRAAWERLRDKRIAVMREAAAPID